MCCCFSRSIFEYKVEMKVDGFYKIDIHVSTIIIGRRPRFPSFSYITIYSRIKLWILDATSLSQRETLDNTVYKSGTSRNNLSFFRTGFYYYFFFLLVFVFWFSCFRATFVKFCTDCNMSKFQVANCCWSCYRSEISAK